MQDGKLQKRSSKAISRRKFLAEAGKAGGFLLALPFLETAAQGGTQKAAMGALPANRNPVPILLKKGLIVDGTGRKGYIGNLLIMGDKIEKIQQGDIAMEGVILDCAGKVVSPGFIDAHSHMDWCLPIEGHEDLKTPFTAQGVTTFVAGNCGYGVAGFRKGSPHMPLIEDRARRLFAIRWNTMAQYFAFLGERKITHNLANLAGHGTTRASIRGFDPSPLREEEMREMLGLLEEAMDQGAHGVSLGLQYEPGVFATMDELKAVARLVKKKDKILTVHLKAYSSLSGTYPLKPFFGKAHNLLAIQDMLDVARDTGVKLQISHLIFVGSSTWKNYHEALAMIDGAVKSGVDVKFDTYAYHCGTSHINVFMPEWFLAKVPAAYEDPSAMYKLRLEIAMIRFLLGFGYEDIQITYANHPELNRYNGMFLSDIARERGLPEFDNFVDFARRSGGLASVLNHRYSNPEIIEALIRHPGSLFMTDALAVPQGVQNPACYGNFPRILQLVRERQLISLEEAIHKMSGATAGRFGIKDRGTLKEGLAADVTVFDYEKIRDNNTQTQTNLQPTGIEAVFVNGRQVLAHGKPDGSVKAGIVLV
jgi:N-acyl-D-amino-acid deacylase